MSSLVTPNQSYLAKQMQFRMAAALAYIMWDLGSNSKPVDGSWNGDPGKALWYPSGWRISDQQFHPRPNWGGGGGNCNIKFSNARFDPERGTVWYGPKRVAENVQVADDAKTKIIKNDTKSTVHVSYEESVEVTDSFCSSVSKGVTLDMTTEEHAEVSASQTVSGEYMGVSAEASLTETFGVSASQSKSESKEEAEEKSEEGTKSESLAIEFDADPDEHYLVTISKEHETSYQDFSIKGVMDFDIALHMPGYSGPKQQHASHHPATDVKVKGFDGLEQFINGFDTNYPKMEGFLQACYSATHRAWDYLKDPSHRYIEVSGRKEASLESNASYHVEQLGKTVPDALAHLPVESAMDVAGDAA